MPLQNYVKSISKIYATGNATEHSYRRDLQNLAKDLVSNITITNEPKRIKCGAPDYVITKKEIPIGYIEAKDIGKNLDEFEKSEQLKRYFGSLDNIILTDYLEFRFYRYGEKVRAIQIATVEGGKIKALPENFDAFKLHFDTFCSFKGQTIKSAEKLAKMMAQKARLMEEVLYNVIKEEGEDNTLRGQFEAFKEVLIHDLDEKTFADIYAQTIAYGLFAAKLHDTTKETFSRQEARTLVPKSNPFLRSLFDYVLGPELDERAVWIVDDLAEIFRAADLEDIMKDFGKSTGQNDPFLHFYETFLGEYDPKLRKSRGVYYTPEPVVNFIVRAVDDILKTEFGLAKGLADTSKIKVKYEAYTPMTTKAGTRKVEKEEEVHRVQILDPAAGTGTFLAEVIKQISLKFEGQKGLWSKYVEDNLIPRLNGFEILMAPYTMCHLKIEMLLKDTGYIPKEDTHSKRIKVFLTNSLEEAHPESGTLFATWLSKESTAADQVKQNTPVMVVIGNPPYSGESANKGEWIMKLMEDYKMEPGGTEKLKERNPKWINDDYVKFIRYGQHFIEKNGSGILAFINPHGYLDNPTFRGMRWHLLKTYDKIFIIDLHGNAKKKEVCPDGSKDENVFDIEQGVSINLFIKTGRKKEKELGSVLHYDLHGKREVKYDFLLKHNLENVDFVHIPNRESMYYMVQKDLRLEGEYNQGISVDELFPVHSTGIVTARDEFTIRGTKEEVRHNIEEFLKLDDETARIRFQLGKDVRDWQVNYARKDLLKTGPDFKNIISISYRPFDVRNTYYTGNSKGFHCMPRNEVMQHFLTGDNIGLMTCRQSAITSWEHVSITKLIADDSYVSNRTRERGYLFPLYLFPEHKPNLNLEIVEQFAHSISLTFTPEKEKDEKTFAPIDILDYIYAVLHSPSYREKYKEFLKIDFPRVPYPKDADYFWKLVKLGGELRQLHLLESPVVEKYITEFPIDGTNVVELVKYEDGKVWINEKQYFDKVPEVAWNFYIGGDQPAQKWLKDRKGRELSVDDVFHYQKIVVALVETDRLMKEIDKVATF